MAEDHSSNRLEIDAEKKSHHELTIAANALRKQVMERLVKGMPGKTRAEVNAEVQALWPMLASYIYHTLGVRGAVSTYWMGWIADKFVWMWYRDSMGTDWPHDDKEPPLKFGPEHEWWNRYCEEQEEKEKVNGKAQRDNDAMQDNLKEKDMMVESDVEMEDGEIFEGRSDTPAKDKNSVPGLLVAAATAKESNRLNLEQLHRRLSDARATRQKMEAERSSAFTGPSSPALKGERIQLKSASETYYAQRTDNNTRMPAPGSHALSSSPVSNASRRTGPVEAHNSPEAEARFKRFRQRPSFSDGMSRSDARP